MMLCMKLMFECEEKIQWMVESDPLRYADSIAEYRDIADDALELTR